MSAPSSAQRASYGRLAAAVVMAAVVIAAGIVGASYLGTATTVTSTVRSTVTSTVSTKFPYNTTSQARYIGTDVGSCQVSGSPGGATVPCLEPFSDAQVFDCLSAASTQAGCTEQMNGTSPIPYPYPTSWTMTIWYPYPVPSNVSTLSNCRIQIKGLSGSFYEFCVTVSLNGFVVSEEAPSYPPPF